MTEEFTKPGVANVTPEDAKKLAPLVKHYGAMEHTFTVCVRDQIKHGLSKDHANRRCAIIKQLAGKKLSQLPTADQIVLLSLPDEQLVRMYWAADLSLDGTGLEETADLMLAQTDAVQGDDLDYDEFQMALSQERERVLDTDAQVGYTSGMDLSVFHFDPDEHPRDAKGKFKEVFGKLMDPDDPLQTIKRPDGGRIVKAKDTDSRVHFLDKGAKTPKTYMEGSTRADADEVFDEAFGPEEGDDEEFWQDASHSDLYNIIEDPGDDIKERERAMEEMLDRYSDEGIEPSTMAELNPDDYDSDQERFDAIADRIAESWSHADYESDEEAEDAWEQSMSEDITQSADDLGIFIESTPEGYILIDGTIIREGDEPGTIKIFKKGKK